MRSESYSVGYGLGGQGYPLRQKRVTYGKEAAMRNPNPYEDGVDVNYLLGKRRETMSLQMVSELVAQMREHAGSSVHHWEDWANRSDTLLNEAADRIEALEAELYLLRNALSNARDQVHEAETRNRNPTDEVGTARSA
jgi:hypothetical protein